MDQLCSEWFEWATRSLQPHSTVSHSLWILLPVDLIACGSYCLWVSMRFTLSLMLKIDRGHSDCQRCRHQRQTSSNSSSLRSCRVPRGTHMWISRRLMVPWSIRYFWIHVGSGVLTQKSERVGQFLLTFNSQTALATEMASHGSWWKCFSSGKHFQMPSTRSLPVAIEFFGFSFWNRFQAVNWPNKS